MKLKYAILCLTGLCVVLIVVEELFQSHSSPHWNSPKSHLVASFHVGDPDVEEDSTNEGILGHRQKGGWIEEDDVDHQSNDVDEDDIWSMKRWKDWSAKVHGKSTESPERNEKGGRRRSKNRRKMKKIWKDDGEGMDENEKLRLSRYIYHEDDELKRLKTPVIENEVKYLSHFLPWQMAENKKHNSFETCRYKKCAFINDMMRADWVVIKAGTIRDHDILTYARPPHQRWLMYTIDPAIRSYRLGRESTRSLFNATMTYNLDADVPQIFGRLRKVQKPGKVDYEQIYAGKSKMTAWFVSHCTTPSRREDFVERMQSVIDVDVFGDCGNMSCGGGEKSRAQDGQVCLPMLSEKYMFYLAFENAFCLDYITEKFFKLFRDDGVKVIPVVRGGFQYKKYLPSGIFVNADDFDTPEELGRYLVELSKDKERYLEMMRRKDEWTLVRPRARHCLLCEFVHSNPPPKYYPNLEEKFGRDSCWYPKNL